MTYRIEGNDPTRTHEYQSPDEVRAMVTGGDPRDYKEASTPDGLLEDLGLHKTNEMPEEQDDEVMVWLTGERTMEESRALALREGRCPTCGRQSECCCQGCETCSQSKMEAGKISAAWAKTQTALGDTDPREMH